MQARYMRCRAAVLVLKDKTTVTNSRPPTDISSRADISAPQRKAAVAHGPHRGRGTSRPGRSLRTCPWESAEASSGLGRSLQVVRRPIGAARTSDRSDYLCRPPSHDRQAGNRRQNIYLAGSSQRDCTVAEISARRGDADPNSPLLDIVVADPSTPGRVSRDLGALLVLVAGAW